MKELHTKNYDVVCFIQDDALGNVLEPALAKVETYQHKLFKGGLKEATSYIKSAKNPRVIFIDCSGHEFVVSAAEKLMEFCPPETRIIILGERHDIGIFRDLLKVGIHDYVAKPLNADLFLQSIDVALNAKNANDANFKKTGKILVFLGSVGGVGATTLAVNCAYSLANDLGKRVTLIDNDMFFGTVATMLDLKASHALFDVIDNPDRLDDLFLESSMTNYGERLRVLGADVSLSESLNIDSPNAVKNVLSLLDVVAEKYHYVVVDLSRHHPELWQAVSNKADKVFLVGDLTVASLRNTLKIHSTLSQTKGQSPIPTLVINRTRNEESTSLKQFTKLLGHHIDVVIPFSHRAVEAADLGIPLVQHAPSFSKEIDLITDTITSKPSALPKKMATNPWLGGVMQKVTDLFQKTIPPVEKLLKSPPAEEGGLMLAQEVVIKDQPKLALARKPVVRRQKPKASIKKTGVMGKKSEVRNQKLVVSKKKAN
ncbi:MAG: AAA family ATPase [Alphaproteobacteria bacterium]